MPESIEPTAWAVRCDRCKPDGLVYFTYDEYLGQLYRSDICWLCPRCSREAIWDDDNYEMRTDLTVEMLMEEEESADAEENDQD